MIYEMSLFNTTARKPVFVHYMPWYASKAISGTWGWHWTMGKFNPDNLNPDGTQPVATHDPPAIGLYDSSDIRALECQVAQMKLAGISGIIIDWYGRADFRDYAIMHRNTEKVIDVIRRAKLQFAICFEDQAYKHQVDAGKLTAKQALSNAADDLAWVQQNWISDKAYCRQTGKPVLLVFGPQYFDGPQWKELRKSMDATTQILGLPHLTKATGLDGPYGWPPVHGGNEILKDTWEAYIRDLGRRASMGETTVAIAFPGFKDIYKEAGLHASYGYIDARNGKTLDDTLQLANDSKASMIQLATWNDYGEGTVVEPTTNGGYERLVAVSRFCGSRATRDNLQLPAAVYAARVNAGSDANRRILDAIAQLLLNGNVTAAAARFRSIKQTQKRTQD
jgi:hypothetical protein